MCRCLKVSRQGYYQWAGKDFHDESDKVILAEIRDIMEKNRHLYGILKVTAELKNRGFLINHKRVERLMKENNIRSKKAKKFKKTTDSKHNFPASKDRVKRNFKVDSPNEAWVSDITYLPTREGWLYLCVWIDLYSRMIVGWSIATSLHSTVVCTALSNALARRPGARPIIHSDRGWQYAGKEFRQLLWREKLWRQSMSRKGDCWDNAVAESFFGTLKSELDFQKLLPAKTVRQEVFEYIESFYNRKRIHSFFLGYKTPEFVENEFRCRQEAS